ncbi:MAG TPA: 2Fe-2S iron-sulfur cluster-binding protein [Steroidobacteraceae bacterium]|jgi:2Fe-2S ferredoxin
MPKVTYIEPSGRRYEVEMPGGTTAMQGAVDNMVPGIAGDCGGCCNCATCHTYVDPEWMARTGPANDAERQMLDGVPDVRPGSRLSCQINVTEELDGLTLHIPASQY